MDVLPAGLVARAGLAEELRAEHTGIVVLARLAVPLDATPAPVQSASVLRVAERRSSGRLTRFCWAVGRQLAFERSALVRPVPCAVWRTAWCRHLFLRLLESG